ncbi:flagellar filament capping protein FliD [Alkaliphilus sp. B6464]|uniref:flagellar filament capping protein FliD n=1 Tax=Alkaliphilus sp. B6464 TaxID=2731219 RepID=UPI001BA67431|nr:flagellar filament capping protein FliD [Alkaliphilus sp. B6464]QUH19000.1 flagellar filament capping protein FliD [Alkaliphilus sp. B6464]
MRIAGIASGMDTEQMIRDLMRAERVRVDKFFRQEESLKWKRDALNTTNKTLADFILKARSGFGLTSTTSTGTILNKTKDSFDWVKKVSSSDESVIKATASANAMEGTHKIEVVNLAEVASVTSKDIKDIVKEDGSFDLAKLGIDETTPFKSLVINGKTFNIGIREASEDYEGDIKSINGLVSAINNAKVGEPGKEVSLELRAAYDSSLGKLMISSKEQGADQRIEISGDLTDRFFRDPKGTENPTHPMDPSNPNAVFIAEGKDAKIRFNGDEITKPSNNFSMFGVNYQLQSKGEITVNVESNVDGIMDKVKSFVEDYNALIDNLNGLLKEKSYRDYQPLTKEEKEAMKDKEIELWEERAKSGLLRGDESINRMLQSMRSGLYSKVEGLEGFSHITQIGITTGNYQSGGKLEVDENKLRAAIIDNPEGVIDLLFQKSDTKVVSGDKESAAKNRAESGLIDRLFSDMIVGMKDIVRRSGTGDNASLYRSVQSNMLIDFVTSGSISVLDKDITGVGTRIAREESLLTSKETRYWKQFTAMEKAMQKMNSQSSWLYAQLGQ